MTLVQESKGIYSYCYPLPPPFFLDRDIKEEAKNKENKGAIQVTHIMVTCVNEVVK